MAWLHKGRYPGLWAPARKPTGPLVLDASHPLAAGLVICLPLASDGRNLAFQSGAYGDGVLEGSDVSIGAVPSGNGLILTAGSATTNYGAKLTGTPNDASWSVFVLGTQAADAQCLAAEAGANGNFNLGWVSFATRFEFKNGGGSNIQCFASSYSYGFNYPLAMGATVGPAGTVAWGYDPPTGAVYRGADGSTSSNIGSGSTFRAGQRVDGYQNAAKNISVVYKWHGRQLTDAEFAFLALNPFCLLIPEG